MHEMHARSLERRTDRGETADLFDVLLVALGAGGPPRGASGVPEGVVVLKGMLPDPWHHHLKTPEGGGDTKVTHGGGRKDTGNGLGRLGGGGAVGLSRSLSS